MDIAGGTHDIFNSRWKKTAIQVTNDERMWKVRVHFSVAQKAPRLTSDGFGFEFSSAEVRSYKASVEIHVVTTLTTEARFVADRVAAAVILFVQEQQADAAAFDGVYAVELFHRFRDDRAAWVEGAGKGRKGGSVLMAGLNAPWVIASMGTGARRAGRIWWPGLSAAWCDPEAGVLQGGAPASLSLLAVAFASRLRAEGIRLVVANPKRWSPFWYWPVNQLGVQPQLRTYRRRWQQTNLGAASTPFAWEYTVPIPLPPP